MTVHDLADLDSRLDVDCHRASSRPDPYWHGLWYGGSQVSWLSPDAARRFEEAGAREVPRREQKFDVDEATGHVFHSKSRARRLRVLAALLQWRTLSHDQLLAISGEVPPKNDTPWEVTNLLWSAGLVDRGTVVTDPTVTMDMPHLFRPRVSTHMLAMLDELPYGEWVSVTGGLGTRMVSGSQHDRHNTLTAELALRAAEHCDVASVLGEQMSARWLFEHGDFATSHSNQHGDAVIVRPDGLKIIVETTASAGANWRSKIDGWLDMMASHPTGSDPGVAVLFVEAAKPDRGNETWSYLRKHMRAVAEERSLDVARGLFERVFAARWRWWFPDAWKADDRFLTLAATRLDRDLDWEPAHVLDTADVPYIRRGTEPLLVNHHELSGVPYFLRDMTMSPRTFAHEVRARAGLDPEPDIAKFLHFDQASQDEPERKPVAA